MIDLDARGHRLFPEFVRLELLFHPGVGEIPVQSVPVAYHFIHRVKASCDLLIRLNTYLIGMRTGKKGVGTLLFASKLEIFIQR